MRIKKCHTAFTLIEMLVVVSLIAILVTLVISVATRLDTQGKINSTKGTLALLNTALSEFYEYGYTYADTDYADFKFPLDCNDFTKTQLDAILTKAFNKTIVVDSNSHAEKYSGTEATYFWLCMVPASKQTVEKIDRKFVIYDGRITVPNEGDFPLIHITDAWRYPLRYDYYDDENDSTVTQNMLDTIKTFPVITSAGPDGIFDTADDIKNR